MPTISEFRKIDTSGKATSLFYAIPAQLTGNATRYQVSSVVEDGKVDRLSETLQDMEDSMVVLISRHANDPSVGLSQHRDIEQFKMYVADTGLMITMAFWDKSVTENEIYQKLLSSSLSINEEISVPHSSAIILFTSSGDIKTRF